MPKIGFLPEHAAHRFARVRQRRRIGRVRWREKRRRDCARESRPAVAAAGITLHAKAARDQPMQDVALDSVVERDNQRRVAQLLVRRLPIAGPEFPIADVPVVGLGAGNLLDQIAADQSRATLWPCATSASGSR